MNPNFALDFRNDQIALLHLQAGGEWLLIGTVAVDDPDLDAAMGYLRATALGLSPRGIAAKLILPNDVVLLTTLNNLSGLTAVRRAQIASALIGLTPYDVADLAYDWTDDGTDAHLAVIARETLAEAEAFATQHRFNPIAFAALPENGLFYGEASFGETALATSLLLNNAAELAAQSAEPQVQGANLPSAQDFQMGEDSVVEDAEIAAPEALELPVDDSADVDLAEVVLSDVNLDMDANASVDQTPADTLSLAEDWGFDTVSADDASAAAVPDFDDGAPQSADVDDLADLDAKIIPAADLPIDLEIDSTEPSDISAAPELPAPVKMEDAAAIAEDLRALSAPADDFADEAPMALDVDQDDLPAVDLAQEFAQDVIASAEPEAPKTSPSLNKAEQLLAAFSARRTLAMGSADVAPRVEPVLSAGKTPFGGASDVAAPMPAGLAVTEPDLAMAPEAGFVDVPFAADNAVPKTVAATPIQSKLVATPKAAKPALRSNAAQKQRAPRKSASPMLGFILTAVLLIALAAAAAMSSYITAAWNSFEMPVLANSAPSAQDEALADGEDSLIAVPQTSPAPLQAVASGATAASTTLASRGDADLPVMPNALPTPAVAAPLAQIAAVPPDTGATVQAAPPDPDVAQTTAPLITPTAQGVMTPEGVLLIAGKPALVPTPRTDVVLAAYAAKNPVVAGQQGAALAGKLPLPRPKTLEQAAPSTADILAANPALAGKKPLKRPAGLAPVLAPVTAPIAVLATDPKLAGKRPALRPDNILAAGNTARLASAAASLTAQAETAKAAEAALNAAGPRSPLAVTISRLPAPRPKGLRAESLRAGAELASLAKAPEPAPEVAPEPAPNVAPEADNEPEEPTQKSSGGARTVVSKQATYRNAINLSNVNLIGVYGSKSNRYALIRLASGRFKKLKVGDRFDGGQVAAITESEMRYSKGGQMVALKMPKG